MVRDLKKLVCDFQVSSGVKQTLKRKTIWKNKRSAAIEINWKKNSFVSVKVLCNLNSELSIKPFLSIFLFRVDGNSKPNFSKCTALKQILNYIIIERGERNIPRR